MSNNAGVSAGNIALQACAYWSITLWSTRAAFDTAAEWAGAIDPSAVVLQEAPFPDAPDLRPRPASAIRTRSTSLV